MPLKSGMTTVSAPLSSSVNGERWPGNGPVQQRTSCFLSSLADLNLVDWSSGNVLAVALDNSVYLWNAGSGDILQLLQMEQPGDYISSVAWIKEGNYLAVGTSNAEVQVSLVPILWLHGHWSQGGACPAGRLLRPGFNL